MIIKSVYVKKKKKKNEKKEKGLDCFSTQTLHCFGVDICG